MQSALVNPEFDNPNVPVKSTSERQKRIIEGLNPTAWFMPDAKYFDADDTGRLVSWLDALNGRKLVPAGSGAPSITREAVCSFTGAIASVGYLNILTASAVSAGSLKAGSVLMTGAATKTRIIRQLSGTTGGVGTYLVDIKQTVAAGTAMTASAFASVNFTGASGQGLYESSLADIWPAAGSGGSVMALLYQTSTAGTYGGGIAGSPISTPIAYFINTSNGSINVQPNLGGTPNGTFNGATAAFPTNAWHYNVARWVGSAAGAGMRTDGAADGTVSSSIVVPATATGSQRLVVGGYGAAGATNLLKGRLAGLMICQKDLGDSANASLLADVEAELASWKTAVTA